MVLIRVRAHFTGLKTAISPAEQRRVHGHAGWRRGVCFVASYQVFDFIRIREARWESGGSLPGLGARCSTYSSGARFSRSLVFGVQVSSRCSALGAQIVEFSVLGARCSNQPVLGSASSARSASDPLGQSPHTIFSQLTSQTLNSTGVGSNLSPLFVRRVCHPRIVLVVFAPTFVASRLRYILHMSDYDNIHMGKRLFLLFFLRAEEGDIYPAWEKMEARGVWQGVSRVAKLTRVCITTATLH